MTGRLFKPYLLLLFSFFGGMTQGQDKDLVAFTAMAFNLLKKNHPNTGVYCEYSTSRQVNACAGKDRLEDRITVWASGKITWQRYRSWAERYEEMPGFFQGHYPSEKWNSLLDALAQMKWDTANKENGPPLPMPSPSETIREIKLFDGKALRKLSLAGWGSQSINLGFAQPGILAPYAVDTVWSLSLSAQNIRVVQDTLCLSAIWRNGGKIPIKIKTMKLLTDSDCEVTTLVWKKSVTQPEYAYHHSNPMHNSAAISSSIPSQSWVTLNPGKRFPISLKFPVASDLKSGERQGNLVQLGIWVQTSVGNDPIRVSLFSEKFEF